MLKCWTHLSMSLLPSYLYTNSNYITHFYTQTAVRNTRLWFLSFKVRMDLCLRGLTLTLFFCFLLLFASEICRTGLCWRVVNRIVLQWCNSHMFNTNCEPAHLETVNGRVFFFPSSLKWKIYNITTIKLWYQLYGYSLEDHTVFL